MTNETNPGTVDGRFTQKRIAAATAETERLCSELNITNADHIALWLEANMADSSLAWLACRIAEAHEAANAGSVNALNRIADLGSCAHGKRPAYKLLQDAIDIATSALTAAQSQPAATVQEVGREAPGWASQSLAKAHGLIATIADQHSSEGDIWPVLKAALDSVEDADCKLGSGE